MRKIYCSILLLFICNLAFTQDILINGKNENRLLTWNDFKGAPDYNSSHDANTFWNLDYGLKGMTLKGDTVKIGSFSVTLSLDENRSWIKSQKQTDLLLKHEQGHFDIGLICQREIISKLNSTVFFKDGLQDKIQTVFSAIMEKYHLLGQQYDKETDHSKNQQAQDTWNAFFAKELNR
jgi:hypothetical protein